MADLLPIREVARRSGVASSALRFYEQRGLISSERAGSGHRRYRRPVLRRIAFIVFAQRIGLSLEEIGAELAKLPPHHAPTRGDWSQLSATWTSRSRSHATRIAATTHAVALIDRRQELLEVVRAEVDFDYVLVPRIREVGRQQTNRIGPINLSARCS